MEPLSLPERGWGQRSAALPALHGRQVDHQERRGTTSGIYRALKHRLRTEPRCTGCFPAARAHIHVRTRYRGHPWPLPGHTWHSASSCTSSSPLCSTWRPATRPRRKAASGQTHRNAATGRTLSLTLPGVRGVPGFTSLPGLRIWGEVWELQGGSDLPQVPGKPLEHRLRMEPRCTGCVPAARAQIHVRTRYRGHPWPLPGHTRCSASSRAFGSRLRLDRSFAWMSLFPRGDGLGRGRNHLPDPPLTAGRSSGGRRAAEVVVLLVARHPKQPTASRRGTSYCGWPGQVAHGCATAASTDMDVRPSGDPASRSAAAPPEAALCRCC